MLSPVTAQRSYGEPRAQTNASVGKFAAQNIIDVSAVVALSYVSLVVMSNEVSCSNSRVS